MKYLVMAELVTDPGECYEYTGEVYEDYREAIAELQDARSDDRISIAYVKECE